MKTIRQKFTFYGWIGVICLIVGAYLCSVALLAIAEGSVGQTAHRVGSGMTRDAMILMLGFMMELVALPLMLVGRVYMVDPD